MAAGVNAVLAILLVPLLHAGSLVHVLDNLPPADTGVVRTEGNLSQLGGIRNDAHLRAAEVIVEQILEPHTGNEQEVPRILSPLLDVFDSAIAGHLSITFAAQAERLVEL